MSENRIVRFLELLKGANDEDQAEMAYMAMEDMDPAAVIEVCVGWAEQAHQVDAMHEALREKMAAPHPAPPRELMTEAEREAFVFDLRMALRQVPPETLRDLGTRRR